MEVAGEVRTELAGSRASVRFDCHACLCDQAQLVLDVFIAGVTHFGQLFKHAAGSPAKLTQHAKSLSLRWIKGIGPSRTLFR